MNNKEQKPWEGTRSLYAKRFGEERAMKIFGKSSIPPAPVENSPFKRRPLTKAELRKMASENTLDQLGDKLKDYNLNISEGGIDADQLKKIAGVEAGDVKERYIDEFLDNSHVPGTEVTTQGEQHRMDLIKNAYQQRHGENIPPEVLDKGIRAINEYTNRPKPKKHLAGNPYTGKNEMLADQWDAIKTPGTNAYKYKHGAAARKASQDANNARHEELKNEPAPQIQYQDYSSPSKPVERKHKIPTAQPYYMDAAATQKEADNMYSNSSTDYVDQYGQSAGRRETTSFKIGDGSQDSHTYYDAQGQRIGSNNSQKHHGGMETYSDGGSSNIIQGNRQYSNGDYERTDPNGDVVRYNKNNQRISIRKAKN